MALFSFNNITIHEHSDLQMCTPREYCYVDIVTLEEAIIELSRPMYSAGRA